MKFLVTGGIGFIGLRVVQNLLQRWIPVVVGELNVDATVAARLPGAEFVALDVSDTNSVKAVLQKHPDITHTIHLAYLMSAEVEANPHLGASVNILGMINLFEVAVRQKLARLVFASSETYYGASQKPYGDRDVTEDDFASPAEHFFTYGMMKVLNEFTAQKYVKKHGISLACARPPVVLGYGPSAVLFCGRKISPRCLRLASPSRFLFPHTRATAGFTWMTARSNLSGSRSNRSSRTSPTTMAVNPSRPVNLPASSATGCRTWKFLSTNPNPRRRSLTAWMAGGWKMKLDSSHVR